VKASYSGADFTGHGSTYHPLLQMIGNGEP